MNILLLAASLLGPVAFADDDPPPPPPAPSCLAIGVLDGDTLQVVELISCPDIIDIGDCPAIIDIGDCPNIMDIGDCPNIIDIGDCPNIMDIDECPDLAPGQVLLRLSLDYCEAPPPQP